MRPRCAFSLIELLVVIAIVALLVGLLLPALASAREAARCAQCLSNTRAIAVAMQLYADDDPQNLYPTARMGAMAPPEMSWLHLTRPYIDAPDDYRCPTDPSTNWPPPETGQAPPETPTLPGAHRPGSYAINAYFTPNHPPYWGVRPHDLRTPSQTIIAAELVEELTADHFMPMFWGDPPAVTNAMMQTMVWDTATQRPKRIKHTRHLGEVANYVFTDGHAATHPFTDTWQQNSGEPPTVDWYDVGR